MKHGKIQPLSEHHISHLKPIQKFITKGVCDAHEGIVLKPQACDVKGAKRFNGQQCVIAKALTRTHKPQAVAVGRSFAYVVIKGLAIRFQMSNPAKTVVEEFDTKGRSRIVPIALRAVWPAVRFDKKKSQSLDPRTPADRAAAKLAPKKRMRKLGVRAIGGGQTT